jgi:hypothetical protein
MNLNTTVASAKLGVAFLIVGSGLVAGCGSGVSGTLRDADEAGSAPAVMSVIYDDHSAGFGERIELSAEGVLTLRRYRPGLGSEPEVAGTVRGPLPPERRMELIQLLLEIEAWKQHDMPEGSINDARASLELRVGSDRSRIWEWADDLDANERLSRVERMLVRFAADLETEASALEGTSSSGGESGATGGDPSDERAVPGVAPVQITDQSRPRR